MHMQFITSQSERSPLTSTFQWGQHVTMSLRSLVHTHCMRL